MLNASNFTEVVNGCMPCKCDVGGIMLVIGVMLFGVFLVGYFWGKKEEKRTRRDR